jgi:hypothetical protein
VQCRLPGLLFGKLDASANTCPTGLRSGPQGTDHLHPALFDLQFTGSCTRFVGKPGLGARCSNLCVDSNFPCLKFPLECMLSDSQCGQTLNSHRTNLLRPTEGTASHPALIQPKLQTQLLKGPLYGVMDLLFPGGEPLQPPKLPSGLQQKTVNSR